MKIKLFICHCLFLLVLQTAGAQNNFRVSKDSISNSKKTEISIQLKRIKSKALQIYPYDVSTFWGSSDYIRLYKCTNLKQYAERLVINDSRIHFISLADSVFTIQYTPEFYSFQTNSEMYYLYTELYKCLFSYDQIDAVSIVLTDGDNLTFLPTISSDLWIPMENALLKKEWFLPDVDYVDFLGVKYIEAGDYSNGKSEYSSDRIAEKVVAYHNMIEEN